MSLNSLIWKFSSTLARNKETLNTSVSAVTANNVCLMQYTWHKAGRRHYQMVTYVGPIQHYHAPLFAIRAEHYAKPVASREIRSELHRLPPAPSHQMHKGHRWYPWARLCGLDYDEIKLGVFCPFAFFMQSLNDYVQVLPMPFCTAHQVVQGKTCITEYCSGPERPEDMWKLKFSKTCGLTVP